MWLFLVLFLFIIQGHFSTSQKNTVRGTAHDTLTVTCEYAPGWEFYNKWLCRGEDWDSCRILIITTGSEQVVKKGRVSIQDSHRRRLFTVTLEDLWYDDEDTYWCGIEQFGTDKGFKFSVIVDSAPDPIDSPKPVARTTPASRASSLPSAHGINSSQPIVLVNPHSRSGTLVISVAAKTLPVWILLVPPLFATLEWLRQG
ncbi:CMRF35-like molecule 7 isoform X2 [Suricata suricatta]|uniref:Immunoglobulin V-set domain-containing protein n=1 Tax=Suricata suricatta TaxID=37032 RepID=A0A673V7B2_SURSU|nr:CMRF35-like molecule 7 isoform X2 [Suricata suricatta]